MRVSSLFGSYLKSSDAKDAPIVATISHVAVEMVGQGADQERKAVVYFEGDNTKPLILNKTNAVTLEQALGGETDNWSGRRIKIRCVQTTFGGRNVDGLRVEALATKAAAKADVDADDVF
jgi:hypothetical protein